MSYGVKTESAIFQRTIENVLTGNVKNMIIYQIDICIDATSREKLKQKKDYILNKLKKPIVKIFDHKKEMIMDTVEHAVSAILTS